MDIDCCTMLKRSILCGAILIVVGVGDCFGSRMRYATEVIPLENLRILETKHACGWSAVLLDVRSNLLYRVQVGDGVGANHGIIRSISSREMELSEIVPDGSGGYRDKKTTFSSTVGYGLFQHIEQSCSEE